MRKPRRKKDFSDVKELDDQLGIVEIFGRRVYWCRCKRSKHGFYSLKHHTTGTDVITYDMRYGKLTRLKSLKDNRRASKYYYDWGEIDRLIFKYFYEKNKLRLKKKKFVETGELPQEIIDIRNEIVERLFNLVNTIIYTHSFHQQIHDGDLFQDSIEKLILLLDNDKHDPVRGTSFTFFTVALKNMIFTQLKKAKRYIPTADNYRTHGRRDTAIDNYDVDMGNLAYDIDVSGGDLTHSDVFDHMALSDNRDDLDTASHGVESEYPVDENLESEFTDE